MKYEIVFNPDGTIHLPDLPPELFSVLQVAGTSPPSVPDSVQKLSSRYLNTKQIRTPLTVNELISISTSSLWEIHDEYIKLTNSVETLQKFVSLLDVKIELAKRSMIACDLCELRCGVNRWDDKRGECGSKRESYYGRCFLNWGEERHLVPSISIFLNGCNWHCPFCQYPEHLNTSAGKLVNPNELSAKINALWQKGGVNIHWIGGNPDQHIRSVLHTLQVCDVPLPVVWNSNGYASEIALSILEGVIDTHIIDFRYGNDTCALHYRAGPRTWLAATRNLKQVANQDCELIIRHLQLPNHFECCTAPIMNWLADNLPFAKLNILNGQYRPAYVAYQFPEIDRRLTSKEKMKAVDLAKVLNLSLID